MRGQNYAQSELEFDEKTGQYVKPSVQTRWRYFQSGWEMAFAVGQP